MRQVAQALLGIAAGGEVGEGGAHVVETVPLRRGATHAAHHGVELVDGLLASGLVEDDLDVTMLGSPIPSTPGTQPVDYTCEGDTFTETSAVIDAEYRRLPRVRLRSAL